MKITNKTSQYRRDFDADIVCEFCGNQEKLIGGYDDTFYHTQVLPNKECSKCNKSTVSGGGQIGTPLLKYPEQVQV
jgi:hypothetical protein